jgi:preprotein translocase subunit YajC
MDPLGGLLFPLLILLVFGSLFLSSRKQRRQVQQMQQLQSSLQVDDVVTTTSGLRGTVVDVSYEDTVDLEIADGVVTTWMRAAIRDRVVDGSADATAHGAGEPDEPDAAPGGAAPGPVTSGPVTSGPVTSGPADRADGDAATLDGPGSSGARADAPSDANGTPRA